MEKLKNLTKQSEFKRKIVIVLALMVLLMAFGIINPAYLSYTNIMTILLATSTNLADYDSRNRHICRHGDDIQLYTQRRCI